MPPEAVQALTEIAMDPAKWDRLGEMLRARGGGGGMPQGGPPMGPPAGGGMQQLLQQGGR